MKIKEKIKKILKYSILPITLATAFISILSVNTYAYETNQESYTMTKETYNNNTYYKFDKSNYNNWTNYVYFMINYTTLSSGNFSVRLYQCDSNHNDLTSTLTNINLSSNVDNTNRTYIWQFRKSDLIDYGNTTCFRIQTSAENFNVVNYDFCQSYEMTLTPYYDTYVSNLENQIDELQSDYDTLQGQYDTLSENYDTLQGQYDTLDEQYSALNKNYELYKGGIPFYKENINNVSVVVNNVQEQYDDDYMTTFGGTYISWNVRDFDYFQNISTTDNEITFTYNFDSNYWVSNLRAVIDLLHTYEDELQVDFYLDSNRVYTYNAVPESDSVLNEYYDRVNFNFNTMIVKFYVNYNTIQNNRTQTIYCDNSFNGGYDLGYSVAEKYYQDEMAIEKTKSKQEGITQGYEEGYRIGASQSNSLYGLVVAVVDTPINIFKSIFNFDILGINIVGVVFGITTLLIIVWLIKKII